MLAAVLISRRPPICSAVALARGARASIAARDRPVLESRSGLLSLAGTADMRPVQTAADRGDPDAQRAIDVYIHRLAGGIASMSAATGVWTCSRSPAAWASAPPWCESERPPAGFPGRRHRPPPQRGRPRRRRHQRHRGDSTNAGDHCPGRPADHSRGTSAARHPVAALTTMPAVPCALIGQRRPDGRARIRSHWRPRCASHPGLLEAGKIRRASRLRSLPCTGEPGPAHRLPHRLRDRRTEHRP